MSFLNLAILAALPLAALPIIIHLIHLHRRRQVKWAATMFLLAAQQMNRGYSRLRRWLILALRMAALAALIFMAARPLAGGLLGLTGGAPQTVLVLLDRSASMEQQDLNTGLTKREAGLAKLTDALEEGYRGRSRLVLIEGTDLEARIVEDPGALSEMPATWATDTTSDIPAMMGAALDYITENQTGRTDVWLLSDLQTSDWDDSGGRWDALRAAFSELPGLRFHLLSYPGAPRDNLQIQITDVARREVEGAAELSLDIDVVRTRSDGEMAPSEEGAPTELPIRIVVNGNTSVLDAELIDDALTIRGHTVPLDRSIERGWGRVELPADTLGSDNTWHFVFDNPPALRSTVISDDPRAMRSVTLALQAPNHRERSYECTVLPPARAAEIEWEETALIVWHAPVPAPDSISGRQLLAHVEAGRSLLFLPPDDRDGGGEFMGTAWGEWLPPAGEPLSIGWWRADTGLLANTRDGSSLAVGELQILRYRAISSGATDTPGAEAGGGEDGAAFVPVARMEEDNTPLIARPAPGENASASTAGEVYFLGTLPGTDSSSLARDGVVLFAALHRLLDTGAASLGSALQRTASPTALPEDGWKPVDVQVTEGPGASSEDGVPQNTSLNASLRAGVLASPEGDRFIALNRAPEEDVTARLGTDRLGELFEGLDHRIVQEEVGDKNKLASEIWRTFIILMAIFLVGEAILSLPPKAAPKPSPAT